jgi:HSP20 family protein
MSIVRWNPFRELEAMHNEMNRLFSQFGGVGGLNSYNRANSGNANAGSANSSQWLLPVDVLETQDTYQLRTALPGIDPKDVNIEVNENVLTISAERRHEDKGEEGSYHWIEQQYGTFSRSVTLPAYADSEKIEARYNNGMLELTVPKRESAKPRRIELQASGTEPRTIDSGAQAVQPQALEEPAAQQANSEPAATK